MKQITFTFLFFLLIFSAFDLQAQKYAPYLTFDAGNEPVIDVERRIEEALKSKKFDILNKYHPADNEENILIIFSRKDLHQEIDKYDRTKYFALAHKVAIYKNKEGKTIVSMLNPAYVFPAYLQKDEIKSRAALKKFTDDAVSALMSVGGSITDFGGLVEIDKLMNYAYRAGQPGFDQKTEMKEYDSFEMALEIIETNLKTHKNRTEMAYSFINEGKKVAVFGLGLQNVKGETAIFTSFGKKYMPALPIELIIIDNKAYMLHPRFRLPLFCPAGSKDINSVLRTLPANIEKLVTKIVDQ